MVGEAGAFVKRQLPMLHDVAAQCMRMTPPVAQSNIVQRFNAMGRIHMQDGKLAVAIVCLQLLSASPRMCYNGPTIALCTETNDWPC